MTASMDRRRVVQGLGCTAGVLGIAPSAVAAPLPPPPIRLATVLARAESARGRTTIYQNTSNPPSERLATWPASVRADCGGFVGWCLGLPRKPPQLGGDTKLGTNQIYADAISATRHRLFLETTTPMVGDIIVYPNYRTGSRQEDEVSGHVALLTDRRPDGSFDTAECASTPFKDPKIRDAITVSRGERPFREHAKLLAIIRKVNPGLDPRWTRPPIYARYLGLVR